MGFSDQDKDNIRTYTGYSSRFYQTQNTAIEQAMSALASDTFAVATVQALIARAQQLDLKIQVAEDRQKFEQVEDLKYRGMKEILALRSQGRMVVGRICAKLGVPPKHDAFSAGAANLTSPFTVPGIDVTGGGGQMKLG